MIVGFDNVSLSEFCNPPMTTVAQDTEQMALVAGEALLKPVSYTHLLFNFTSNQIRQIVLDKEWYSTAKKPEDVDEILDDLGYTANDLMNVNFVFIVEGKQDKSRLPLLLDKYYSEILDEEGKPYRMAIILSLIHIYPHKGYE